MERVRAGKNSETGDRRQENVYVLIRVCIYTCTTASREMAVLAISKMALLQRSLSSTSHRHRRESRVIVTEGITAPPKGGGGGHMLYGLRWWVNRVC